MAKLTVVDVTLRDGNHTVRQQFTPELMSRVATALDAAGVAMVEVGHGDGSGGSSIHVGRTVAPDAELLRAVVSSVKKAKVAIFLIPGFGTMVDLQQAYDNGVTVARVACHCTEADITEQHIQLARKLDMLAVGYLISFGMAPPERIAEEARKMESYGGAVYQPGRLTGDTWCLIRSGNMSMRCATPWRSPWDSTLTTTSGWP